ncbi:MAG: hypothetical protein OJF49_000545 [Ktedonobacterales bacterium]|jgi:hypothetical protein|nr:MAG: hypothetical protein OJF49_000545 [Ktedonobacterales bacterium]
MDEERTTLATEIAAELELSVVGSAKTLTGKLRQSERLRQELRARGLVRQFTSHEEDARTLDIAGVAVAAKTLPAFGGLLYGTTAHAHHLRLAQHDILGASEQVQVHIGDLDYYETTQRMRWKRAQHAFELLTTVLEADAPPRVTLLDVPIFVSRGDDRNRAQIEDVEEEWLEMLHTINGFWRAHFTQLYPLRADGVTVASVQNQNATPLFTALNNNPKTSPDAIPANLALFIQREWRRLRQAGMSRLVEMLVTPGSRTVAYSFEDINLATNWEPNALHHSGILGFFMRAGERTPIWQIQVAGHREHWTSDMLDRLADDIARATLATGDRAEPLPLWYARRLAAFPQSILALFRDLVHEQMQPASASEPLDAPAT